eukprot:CCRYP_014441-RA/>CCRYP_014441-RA protein AED:0.07 eAED:0.07 QI:422/0/0.5/1/1/1/2/0/463
MTLLYLSDGIELYYGRFVFWWKLPSRPSSEFFVAKFLSGDVLPSGIDHTSSNSSPSISPSKSLKSPANQAGGRHDQYRLLILLHGLCISARFLFVVSWCIIKRISSIFLPLSQRNRDRSHTTSHVGEKLGRNNDFCLRLKQHCPTKVFLPALFALSLSFWILGTLSTIVINSNVNNVFGVSDSVSDDKEYQKTSSFYFRWILGPHSPLKFMVKMSCALGMIIASVINGFGCASMPHAHLVGKYLKPTSSAVLAKVEEDYFYAVKVLEEKTVVLSGLMRMSMNGTVESNQVRQLRQEINFMENLVGDMSDDIEEMKHSQELALKARTKFGRISWILGMVFSIILVIRVALAASSILVTPRVSDSSSMPRQHRDPITTILMWLTGHHVMSLPIECRSSFSTAVGKLDFRFNSALLNTVFCTSTCTSALVLGFLFGIKRNNSERYNIELTFSPMYSFLGDNATHTA